VWFVHDAHSVLGRVFVPLDSVSTSWGWSARTDRPTVLLRILEFKFILDDDTELKGSVRRRIGGSAADLAERQRDLTPVMARLGPVDLWTLDTLITAGIAASRAEALRWVLARIRERPAYAKLSHRAHELDELKAQF
jgi:hypothetical protein